MPFTVDVLYGASYIIVRWPQPSPSQTAVETVESGALSRGAGIGTGIGTGTGTKTGSGGSAAAAKAATGAVSTVSATSAGGMAAAGGHAEPSGHALVNPIDEKKNVSSIPFFALFFSDYSLLLI